MQKTKLISLTVLMVLSMEVSALQEEKFNTTSSATKILTYAGSLLPSDWSLVSLLNDRAIIGFVNGSARNTLVDELNPEDRLAVQRIQNGTLSSTTLANVKDKFSQWSSSFSSTINKFGQSVKEEFDKLVNKNRTTTPSPMLQ